MALVEQGFGAAFDETAQQASLGTVRVRSIVAPSEGRLSILGIVATARSAALAVIPDGFVKVTVYKGKGNWNINILVDPVGAGFSVIFHTRVATASDAPLDFDSGELVAKDGEQVHIVVGPVYDNAGAVAEPAITTLAVTGVDETPSVRTTLR